MAWVSADAGDDLQRLLECMLAALEPFDPPWRTAPESLVTRVGRATSEEQRTLAAEIINTLDACEVPHGIIAFEDVHRVDDAEFFGFLDLLIERLSSRWSIAITSRTEPPLALARLRARDELAEFRQLQLQFARDDARRLAAESGLDMTIADRLFDRTQGWPAGMRIAIGAVLAGDAPNTPAPQRFRARACAQANDRCSNFLSRRSSINCQLTSAIFCCVSACCPSSKHRAVRRLPATPTPRDCWMKSSASVCSSICSTRLFARCACTTSFETRCCNGYISTIRSCSPRCGVGQPTPSPTRFGGSRCFSTPASSMRPPSSFSNTCRQCCRGLACRRHRT